MKFGLEKSPFRMEGTDFGSKEKIESMPEDFKDCSFQEIEREESEHVYEFEDCLIESIEEAETGKIEISKRAFDAVPEQYTEAINETFEKAPDEIKIVINEYSEKLKVGPVRSYYSGGILKKECNHYNQEEGMIRMNESLDADEYAEVFRHEYGHFIDSQLNDASTSGDFGEAIDADLYWFHKMDNDNTMKKQMLNDLAATDVISDRCISDILSGTFRNDLEIQNKYIDEKAAYYGHKESYWDGTDGPKYAREREVFAEFFSIYSASDKQDSKEFVEKYFPNTTRQFKRIMKMKGE